MVCLRSDSVTTVIAHGVRFMWKSHWQYASTLLLLGITFELHSNNNIHHKSTIETKFGQTILTHFSCGKRALFHRFSLTPFFFNAHFVAAAHHHHHLPEILVAHSMKFLVHIVYFHFNSFSPSYKFAAQQRTASCCIIFVSNRRKKKFELIHSSSVCPFLQHTRTKINRANQNDRRKL